MYESRIAADHLTVVATSGLAPEIDALAACNLGGHGFLRSAWYAAGCDAGQTMLLRGVDGNVLAAIPTAPFGPAIAGARKVPGSYWPFRSPLIAPECTAFELAHALRAPAARALGPALRIGPARSDDQAVARLTEAAKLANWAVLARDAGTSWAIDLDTARAGGWPRNSTAKRLARIERRLASLGTVAWRHVRGSDWNDSVLDQLAAVEAASWIAAKTDGRGAKFMTAAQRAAWRTALADPVLAGMLCATLLTIDGQAVAFSFDLDDGPVRYGIAGSYMTAFGNYEVGKLANYRAVTDAIEAGQRSVDLGAGDSGYKREMGAAAAYDFTDLLFVRNPAAARLLARVWGAALEPGKPAGIALEKTARG